MCRSVIFVVGSTVAQVDRVGRAGCANGAACPRIGIRHAELVVIAEALLHARLQAVVIEPAGVDQLEYRCVELRRRQDARHRGRPRRVARMPGFRSCSM